MTAEKTKGIGLYIHVPFCDGKCPYCDFYSMRGSEAKMDEYVRALRAAVDEWSGNAREVKTVYFGGGTPNLLGAERLSALLCHVKKKFRLSPEAEITLEANPTKVDEDFFRRVREAGFDRLSMGMQSANEDELALLGRKHSSEDVTAAVRAARAAGLENISLDLMLGLPGSGPEKLKRSIAFAADLGVEHISAYILKIEEGTPFAERNVSLPDGDAAADEYLFCVSELERHGYGQYEISNFSRPGMESRHNLVYWRGEEYLGLGPGAHSFLDGKRFFYPRDMDGFINGSAPVSDGEGGNISEFIMLNLRLTEGITAEKCRARFGPEGERAFEKALKNAKKCPPGLLRADSGRIYFTPEGFLVSNSLILRLTDGL